MTLTADSIDQFLRYKEDRGSQPNTIKAYRSDLLQLLSTFTSQDDPATIPLETSAARWLSGLAKTQSPKTIQRKLASVRAWATWAGMANFLSDYKPPTPAQQEAHAVLDGIKSVLLMCEVAPTPEKRALIALCGLCGLRVSEARSVWYPHIDHIEYTVLVRGKGNKHRVVPISERAWHFIKPVHDKALAWDAPLVNLSDRAARQAITDAARWAGVKQNVASHMLRATFATAAYENSDHDLRAVQQLLGHSSPVTTMVYTGVKMASMRKAVNL